jgi:hypothetical protein
MFCFDNIGEIVDHHYFFIMLEFINVSPYVTASEKKEGDRCDNYVIEK